MYKRQDPNRSGGYGGLEEQETHKCSIGAPGSMGHWDHDIKSETACKKAGGKWVDLKKFRGKFGEAREDTWPDKESSGELGEVLGPDAEVGEYIEDFQDSDAPQFKGKSKKKKAQMAYAAHAAAKE